MQFVPYFVLRRLQMITSAWPFPRFLGSSNRSSSDKHPQQNVHLAWEQQGCSKILRLVVRSTQGCLSPCVISRKPDQASTVQVHRSLTATTVYYIVSRRRRRLGNKRARGERPEFQEAHSLLRTPYSFHNVSDSCLPLHDAHCCGKSNPLDLA
jgi:hypothetical protein